MGMNAELRLVDGGIGKVILNHILETHFTIVVDDIVLYIRTPGLAEDKTQQHQQHQEPAGKSVTVFPLWRSRTLQGTTA